MTSPGGFGGKNLPNYSGTANMDYVVSPKFYVSARAGYFLQNLTTENNFQGDRFVCVPCAVARIV